ncbi:MAG TPA: sulfotransferase [Kiloniellaceae bacterium]
MTLSAQATTSDAGPAKAASRLDGFRVTPWVHRCGRFVARHRDLWVRLGNAETKIRAADIEQIDIVKPVFVCGLARAGTTILLETLARHPLLGSHRYRDDPFVFTPIFWNSFLARLPERRSAPAERAHGDGIVVTADSPEAFEEELWMAFFGQLHDPHRSAVLDAETDCPEFERFFRDHLRKLLWVRRRPRYLSKANYNVTRMAYLLKLFPDARFVLPLRDPAAHIASLVKQHRLFCQGERRHPAALDHMQRIGHFEFGLDRRPINVGDGAMGEILQAFHDGEEVRGWALYWASLHNHLADRLAADVALQAAVKAVRFEELCRRPQETLAQLFAHCDLPDSDALIAEAAGRMRMPSYYRPDFSAADLATIRQLTGPAARRFGYDGNGS